MISEAKLFDQLKNNSISNEDLIRSLNSENYSILCLAMSRLIERNIYSETAIERLGELSQRLGNNKFIGAWEIGHFAVATLGLLSDKKYKNSYKKIYKKLSSNDRFLVDNFIKSEAYKL